MTPKSCQTSWPRCSPIAGRDTCGRAAVVEFVLDRFGEKRIYRCDAHAGPMRLALATFLSGYRSSERRLCPFPVAPPDDSFAGQP